MSTYHCHGCGRQFPAEVKNDYGTYEFRRCPYCNSAKTTFA